MDIKKEIRESQGHLLDQLAQYESSISDLYAVYARLLPDMSTFWQTLSKEETGHAQFLNSFHKLLENGAVFFNLDRFNAHAILNCLAEVHQELARTKQGPVSLSHALTTALSIETAVLDGHFYDTVKTDTPEFIVIAEHLSKDTYRHRSLILEKYNALRKGL